MYVTTYVYVSHVGINNCECKHCMYASILSPVAKYIRSYMYSFILEQYIYTYIKLQSTWLCA